MTPLSLLAHCRAQRARASRLAGKVLPSESLRGWRGPTPRALDGRLEVPETFFLDAGRQLRAKARESRGLVGDHAAARLLDGRADRVDVERRHRAHVDDLRVEAELFRGRFADVDHRAVGHDRDLLA